MSINRTNKLENLPDVQANDYKNISINVIPKELPKLDVAIAMAMASALRDAEKCFVREEKIEEICEIWNARHPNKEFHPHNPIPQGFSAEMKD